jgi:hypothetical protein
MNGFLYTFDEMVRNAAIERIGEMFDSRRPI